jgi:hypothetical protein
MLLSSKVLYSRFCPKIFNGDTPTILSPVQIHFSFSGMRIVFQTDFLVFSGCTTPARLQYSGMEGNGCINTFKHSYHV